MNLIQPTQRSFKPCASYNGRGGDHGINAQGTLATCGVEEPSGFAGLRFIKRNEVVNEGADDGDLCYRFGAAGELIPCRHGGDECFPSLAQAIRSWLSGLPGTRPRIR